MSITSFIQRVCVQTAVYWGNPVDDGYGTFTYDDPVEVACRWEDKQKIIRTADGRELISRAQILVPTDKDLQGYLYLGSLDDFESGVDTSNPKTIDGAYEIIAVDKIPMIRSTTVFVRTVYL